ncbi:MAG: alpha/beta fold hydrolase [Elusimicrobia bacterium]|nr:alpha/beta fold hydrolase [Elusimicrobiota bacterium]
MKFKTEGGFIITFLFVSLVSCSKPISDSEPKSEMITKDGVVLVGKFVSPGDRNKLTFILLHGLGSGKSEWFGFADKLSKRGYGYLAVDIRGHGESTKTESGGEISYQNFGMPGPDSQWSKIIGDVDVAVNYLTKKRNIKKDSIALIGASLGANAALIYSANHKFIPFVVLLSPGLNYAELLTALAMKEYGKRPILFAASPLDKYAYESSGRLVEIANGNNIKYAFLEGKNSQHGVQMFDGKFENKLLDWIDQQK